MHFSGSMDAFCVTLSNDSAFGLHARMHGRVCLMMAEYGQAAAQRPHSTHFSRSITACRSTMEIAFFGQALTQWCAMQPRHACVTMMPSTGHSSHAMGSTSTTFGSSGLPPSASFTRWLMIARSL